MLKCYKRDCPNKPIFECTKEDMLLYSCNKHTTNEKTFIKFDHSIPEKPQPSLKPDPSLQEREISSLKLFISKKQTLLKLLSNILENVERFKRFETKIKSKHLSNQFIMNGLIGLRHKAGQKQDRNLAHMYKLAMKALQKYPLPILHPEQALDLQGLGQASIKSLHSFFISNCVKYKNLKKSQTAAVNITENTAGQLQIKLYIDQRETRGSNIISLVESANIPYTIKTLALGDYIFIAENGENQYVLDTIIERKSSCDLSSSHFSNHLRDQVRRLKSCTCDQKILLVEGKCDYNILSEMWLKHNLIVLNSLNLKRSIELLALLYADKASQFKNPSSIEGFESFETFQNKHGGNDKVGEVFYRQILEFPGMTAKKLNLFVSLYPTMIDFLRSFKESKILVHQNLMWCGIGQALENSLYDFFGMKR